MQLTNWPKWRLGQTCIDHTCTHKRLLVRPCVLHHATSHLRRNMQRDRSSTRRCHNCRAVSSADQSVEPREHSAVTAFKLVHKLAENLTCLKERPLPSSCSLSIYRLTVLCHTEHQSEVASALAQVTCEPHRAACMFSYAHLLASNLVCMRHKCKVSSFPECALQDSRLHEGNGVFLHMVHMLQSSEDGPTQGLAADFIQAMLSSECASFGMGFVPASAVGLNHTNAAFDVNQLLQLIINSNHVKVCVCRCCQAIMHIRPGCSCLVLQLASSIQYHCLVHSLCLLPDFFILNARYLLQCLRCEQAECSTCSIQTPGQGAVNIACCLFGALGLVRSNANTTQQFQTNAF